VRIALLHYTYAPTIGGVEQVMVAHVSLFATAEHEVTVVSGDRLQPARLASALAGVEVAIAHNLLTMPFLPEVTRALWRLAEAHPEVRFIAWTHDVAAANPHYAAAVDAEGELFRSFCPHFEYIAVSERRRRELHETMGVPPARSRVVPNGIWPLQHWRVSARWHPFIAEARLLERDLVLLHPARLVRRKNIESSLAITAALRSAGHDAALLITAPGDVHQADGAVYRQELLDLRARLGLEEHAFFLTDSGPATDADLASFYEMSDAVLFPSTQEGFGLPVLEAALHRVPIFCRAIEPLTELPAAPLSLYPESASAEEIAHLIMRTLKESPAMQLRRRTMREYAWPAVYRNYIAPLLAGTQTYPNP
jgi:glycosyltransferase involved in cell wall biosynthesis